MDIVEEFLELGRHVARTGLDDVSCISEISASTLLRLFSFLQRRLPGRYLPMLGFMKICLQLAEEEPA